MKVSLSKLSHHPLNEEIYSLSSIEDLMSSIDEVGLLQPLVVNQKFQVLSGNRRLEAVTRLGWKSVEVEKIDSDSESEPQMIVHFNKQRVKTCRELLNEIYILMPQYSVGQGKRTDLTNVRTNKSSARDEIADLVGMSSSQIGKLLFIEKNDPDFITLIDDGQLTINQAYISVSRAKKQQDAIIGNVKSIVPKDEEFVFYNKSSHDMSEFEVEGYDTYMAGSSLLYQDTDSMSGISIDISRLSRDRKKFIMDNCSEGFCAATLNGVAQEVEFSQGLVVTEVSKIKKPSLFSIW